MVRARVNVTSNLKRFEESRRLERRYTKPCFLYAVWDANGLDRYRYCSISTVNGTLTVVGEGFVETSVPRLT